MFLCNLRSWFSSVHSLFFCCKYLNFLFTWSILFNRYCPLHSRLEFTSYSSPFPSIIIFMCRLVVLFKGCGSPIWGHVTAICICLFIFPLQLTWISSVLFYYSWCCVPDCFSMVFVCMLPLYVSIIIECMSSSTFYYNSLYFFFIFRIQVSLLVSRVIRLLSFSGCPALFDYNSHDVPVHCLF